MKNKIILLFITMASLFFACKKENENPQWDINVLGPLAYASLGMENLIGDSNLSTGNNGELFISIDTSFSNFTLDSVYKVPDTTLFTSVIFPAFPAVIQPNTPFLSSNNNLTLGVNNVQLRAANIKSGFIKIDFKNTLQSKIFVTYVIPKAKKNGSPFTITFSVDSASLTNPTFFTATYDFSGYAVDMTGSTGGSFNTISYNVEARSNPAGQPFNLFGSDTLINLKTSMLSITPDYVRGYLGQTDLSDSKEVDFGLGTLIQNGTIVLDSVTMKFDITNYIGADIQAYVDQLLSVNNRTLFNLPLNNSQLIQHPININRATETFNGSYNPTPFTYSLVLDKNNSNIKEVIENLPDKLRYDLRLKLNPLGNISGSSDFIYSDKLVDTRVRLDMPLSFSADQLLLSDTIDFGVTTSTDFDPIGPSTIYLLAKNGFPFDLDMELFLIDANNVVIDNILVPGLISSAQVNGSNIVTQTTTTKIAIPIDANRKSKLTAATRIGIRAKLDSPNYPQLTQLYTNYRLDLKFIGDGTYSIR